MRIKRVLLHLCVCLDLFPDGGFPGDREAASGVDPGRQGSSQRDGIQQPAA